VSRLQRSRDWVDACCRPRAEGAMDRLIGLGIALAYLLLLVNTVDQLGYARDEGFYFHAARSYQAWFELLWSDTGRALDSADAFWKVNHEHPALIKSSFAISHWLLWDRWQLFAMEGTSYRFPAMVLSAMGVGLSYLWGARARGRLVGLVAALSLALMPRFFFHAHLACFDAPVVSMWLLCSYCYWRAIGRGGWLWPLLVGISFGLALNTKHNAWFLPIVCGLHALYSLLPGAVRGIERRVVVRRAALALGAMAVVGPLLFYATWPWIWHDTAARLEAYARFHLSHVYYNMEFLGDNYWRPPMPRGYAFAMTAFTVPVITLLCFVVGVVVVVRRDGAPVWRRQRAPLRAPYLPDVDPATGAFWMLAMAVQYGAWLSPTTPIFGGTKHWMTAYPFLVLLAGEGVRAALLHARHRWQRGPLRSWLRGPALELCLLTSVLLPPAVQALHAHPWGLSSYNVLAGGAAGGANLGLNRGFWGYTTGSVAPYLNETTKKGARIYVHDTARAAWDMLVRDGRVRSDLRQVYDVAQSDVALYHHEKHMSGQEYQAWVAFGGAAPAHIDGLDGVPVIWIYAR